ncbi:transcription factor WhiB [Streptomyces sp. Amel2xB2]|uniref:WhiB family transcriptional regulator n=1 Tax=Streptomyces sp. Amel2xB2 TaxID=1305829 RepID=UPI000DBFFF30|nr:WhiB family transcriptional regulator [Streptomyces sp. Amel2xB2]RAJ70217.1 transcription factor WhiB [Streptomyces sp. Amel2xB2]
MTPASASRTLTGRLERRLDWHDLGTCREDGRDPAMWEADYGKKARQARALCWLHCPVRVRCLMYTLEQEAGDLPRYRFGVAGGLNKRERAELDRGLRERREARTEKAAA